MRNPENNPQEPRRQKTRAALLRAGADLLAERPIDAIPVDDIVRAAGVAKGSFFNHFVDKDAFAAAIAAEIRAEIETQVTAANLGVVDAPLRIARAVAGFVGFARREPRRARIMLRGHELTDFADNPLNRGLQADIDAGRASGRLSAPSTASAIIYVGGIAQMLLRAVLAGPMSGADLRRTTTEVLILSLSGLGLAAPEAARLGAAAADEILPD